MKRRLQRAAEVLWYDFVPPLAFVGAIVWLAVILSQLD